MIVQSATSRYMRQTPVESRSRHTVEHSHFIVVVAAVISSDCSVSELFTISDQGAGKSHANTENVNFCTYMFSFTVFFV